MKVRSTNQYMIEGFFYALEKKGFDVSASEMAHSLRDGELVKSANANRPILAIKIAKNVP